MDSFKLLEFKSSQEISITEQVDSNVFHSHTFLYLGNGPQRKLWVWSGSYIAVGKPPKNGVTALKWGRASKYSALFLVHFKKTDNPQRPCNNVMKIVEFHSMAKEFRSTFECIKFDGYTFSALTRYVRNGCRYQLNFTRLTMNHKTVITLTQLVWF